MKFRLWREVKKDFVQQKEKETMEFKFTESWPNINSSLVKAVFHDEDTNRMLVRLTGDKQYVYNNVDRGTAEDIAEAPSAGSEYNWFRNNRGTLQTGAAAHNLRPVVRLNLVDAIVPSDNPKSNTYTTYVSLPTTPEVVSVSNGITRTFNVSFDWDGEVKNTTVQATSLVEAINKVEQSFKVLNLNVTVTGVALKR